MIIIVVIAASLVPSDSSSSSLRTTILIVDYPSTATYMRCCMSCVARHPCTHTDDSCECFVFLSRCEDLAQDMQRVFRCFTLDCLQEVVCLAVANFFVLFL